MNHRGTILIETPRLILRPFAMEDCEAAFRNWESDEKTTEFLRWKPAKSVEETAAVMQSWVERYVESSFYQWAIVPKALDEPIGSMSVVGMKEETCTLHLGYCIGSRWWRKGYTSEALAAILPYLFDVVGAQRIESQHDPDNPNSGKVMQK